MSIENIYRKYGIRNETHFTNPPITEFEELKLESNCIVHALPFNTESDGPVTVEPVINSLMKGMAVLYVEHVIEIKNIVGAPRVITRGINNRINNFHKRNRFFKRLRRVETVLNSRHSSLILNYSYLTEAYHYPKRILSKYELQASIFNAISEQIMIYNKKTDRAQFIEFELPNQLREINQYQAMLKRNLRNTLGEIEENEYWTFALINYLLEEDIDNFNFIKEWQNVYFYWTAGNRVVFLSFDLLKQMKEKDSRKTIQVVYRLLEKMISIQPNEEEIDSPLEVAESNIDEPFENEVIRQTEKLVSEGAINNNQRERYIKLSESYKNIPNPMGEGTLENLVTEPTEDQISLDDVQLLDSSTIVDKSMTKSTLTNYDAKYAKELFQKDVVRMVLNLQRAGIAITDYHIEEKRDSATEAYVFKIRLAPLNGKPSTIEFQLPKIQDNGTFIANNVVSRLDKQRGDMPIRKIKPDRVALTSYYGNSGKLFIDRDSKIANDLGRWTSSKLIKIFENENSPIESLSVGDVFDSSIKVPRIYSAIAMRIQRFKYKNYEISFSYHDREKYLGEYKLREVEKGNRVVCGKKGSSPLCIDIDNNFSVYNGEFELIGDLDTVLDGILGKGPIEFTTMVIMGRPLAVGLVLSYKYGITNLLKKINAKYRLLRRGSLELSYDEYEIRFSDFHLIIKNNNPIVNLIMAGFLKHNEALKNYNFRDFDKRDVYLNIVDIEGLTIRHLREIDLIFQLFIDPITLELLKQMNEPTSVDGLLLRAVELLTSDEHPRETDMEFMRIKGYERLAGNMYRELINSVRGFTNSPDLENRKIELHPKVVWLNIVKDPAISQINETNPVQNLREMEKVSYSGIGGRKTETMVRRTREFHPNDRGVISESSTDNSKTGVITYMTADPNIKDLRGGINLLSADDGVTPQVSTSFLLSPSADRDEGKRVNFVGIQYAHTIAIEGNEVQPIRTGYESVIAHRADAIYAGVAKLDGVITEINKDAVKVKYKNNTEQTFKLGKTMAKTPGMNLVHEMITDREVGYKFTKDEVLCFNKGFFSRDLFNQKQVCFLMGTLAKVALMEGTDTLEDSCAISEEMSKRLATTRTQVRNIVVNFEQAIHKLVKIGDEVEVDSPLCVIEDAVTAGANLFDEDTVATLEMLSANVPKAKYKGVIEEIEIIYYGEISDMSENLANLAKDFDRQKRKRLKNQSSNDYPTNQIKESILIEESSLNENSFVIKVYISGKESMDIGDKGVFVNQLKTTVGRVMTGINETESGIPIDAIFGFKSIANRVVLSPQINGLNTGALKLIGKEAAKIYFE